MNRTIRFAGLVLASLTISTVAMAQQGGGGGRGGDGGGNGGSGGGGDPSILQVLREDHARARLTRAVELRRAGTGCLTHVCNEPPPPRQPPVRQVAETGNACAGGEVFAVRGRGGQIIRYFCEYP
ncbi:hypothetical protein J2Y55_001151 [Bosea sp. BE125]|uniref:hypothetical protein n=1 Tax=Bosea sp. BE125 TaxID=2817909 RepID=UPI00285F9456|nr:hypothetical protein [Bosea sp. BE125]MDR6870151.1 hypothetical protein [Bosea sp. BE125]